MQRRGWLPIETAPKDGTLVHLKRVYDGETQIFAGKWAARSADAPARFPLVDPLGRGVDWPETAILDAPHWVTASARYRVPEPTHWMPVVITGSASEVIIHDDIEL